MMNLHIQPIELYGIILYSYTFRLIVDPEGGCARLLLLPLAEPVPVPIDSE
jgi:hypothetical protein